MPPTRAVAGSKCGRREAEVREYDQKCFISGRWESAAATTYADCAVHYTAHVTYNGVYATTTICFSLTLVVITSQLHRLRFNASRARSISRRILRHNRQ
eukprot:COSAG02_NODE_11191_length_1773_cov_6.173238_4_plen_99_part_00